MRNKTDVHSVKSFENWKNLLKTDIQKKKENSMNNLRVCQVRTKYDSTL